MRDRQTGLPIAHNQQTGQWYYLDMNTRTWYPFDSRKGPPRW
jgi:hypothetical protein